MDEPNWKHAADYVYTKDLDAAGWAWEFLRRNKKYRKDYHALVSGTYTTVSYKPPKNGGESDQQWMNRCIQNNVEATRFSPERTLARKWGLKGGLRDPSVNAIELKAAGNPVNFDLGVTVQFPRTTDELQNLPTEEEDELLPPEVEEGGETVIRRDRLVAVLDLTGPITPQLADIKKAFQSAKASMPADAPPQDPPGKPKHTVFLQGIRVLDAGDKVPKHEIGKVLFKDDAADVNVKIHDCLVSAEANRDRNYLAIARRRKPIPGA